MKLKSTSMEINGFTITLVRKTIKNWYLRICPITLQIQLSAPRLMSQESIIKIIEAQSHWIKKQLSKLPSQPTPHIPQMIEGEQHYFQGEAYILRVREHQGRGKIIIPDHVHMELHVDPKSDALTRLHILHRWYRQQLLKTVPPLLEKWQNQMGVTLCDWRIKKMKTLWGSCNTQEKRIWLNLELIKKPLACIEYIIVHELVHLFERKHNKRFYAYMDSFLPNWRELKQLLENSKIR